MLLRILYFVYQWVIVLPMMLLLTLLTALTVIIGCTFGKCDFWAYYPGRIWSRLVCALCLLPVHVKGRAHLDPAQSYIFVANHQGAFDIFLIYGYLNRSFKWIMKKSLRKMPFVGKACHAAGHIFIDDSGVRGVKSSLLQARESLAMGHSIVIFPEGSRTLDGHIHRFKRGAFQMAEELQIPVVPLTIEGPYQVLKRGSVLLEPHPLRLTIHKPIHVVKDQEGEAARIQKEAFEIISSSLA